MDDVLATYERYVGTILRIGVTDEDPIELRMLSITELSMAPNDPRLEGKVPGVRTRAFSILFEGSRERQLMQGIYRLETEDGATHDIFIVPVGPSSGGGALYESVFN